MNNGNIKGKSTLSETSPRSYMAHDKLTMGKGKHKHDGSTDPTMKCDVLQYHDCTNVTVNDDVEIIDTNFIDALPLDADKCVNVAALVHVIAINTRWRLSLESWSFSPAYGHQQTDAYRPQ